MIKTCLNIAKIGRKHAGLTQEEAAELLGCSVRTLCDYEHGIGMSTKVAAKMAKAYNFPILALWYVKYSDPCGEFLPDIVDTQSDMDMGFLIHLSHDGTRKALEQASTLLQDGPGPIAPDRIGEAHELYKTLWTVTGRCLSSAAFLDARYGRAA